LPNLFLARRYGGKYCVMQSRGRGKSLFAAFSSEKEESVLSLKKKQQKDSCFRAASGQGWFT
jgi:hypothetical protein